mmetsp:Transcript_6112/g.14839  ORF Transcript_6112/g.14839 Transcript_6112/m.14839 type:complete len:81 (-) Transcript_6112:1491-1733(-)
MRTASSLQNMRSGMSYTQSTLAALHSIAAALRCRSEEHHTAGTRRAREESAAKSARSERGVLRRDRQVTLKARLYILRNA